jgi:peptidoglycan/xylan/chitin deacetylase (PgdA/CDA1 family)
VRFELLPQAAAAATSAATSTHAAILMTQYPPSGLKSLARCAKLGARMTRNRALAGLTLAALGAAIVVATVGRSPSRPSAVVSLPPPPPRVRPLRTKRAPPVFTISRAAVPILMYHVIAPPPAGAPFPLLYVKPRDLSAQVDTLARAGFHAVTLDEVWAAWHRRGRLPPRPIVLSFDNGYHTQYTEALPILRRVGWVGVENLQLAGLPLKQGGLSARQVRGLVSAGWELDTQGYSHADLVTLDPTSLQFQVATARARIRRAYGVRADWFCYPSGRYDNAVIDEVRAAGFIGATTVVAGWARPSDDPFTLPRLRVVAGTTPRELLALIAGTRDA